MLNKNLEDQLFTHEKKAKEFKIQNETLDREIDELLDSCNVTEDQLSAYISSPDYFSKEQWEALQKEKKRIEDEFKHKLSCVFNPIAKKKAQEERFVAPHWLFVR